MNGALLKHEGMQRAFDFEGIEWQQAALSHLRLFAARHAEFTAEQFRYDFLTNGGKSPVMHKCWGALFSAAAKRGLIAKTGRYVLAQSAKTHSHPVTVWRSAL